MPSHAVLPDPESSRLRVTAAASLALVASAFVVLHLLDSPRINHPLSAYSLGPASWLYRAAFLVLGLFLLLLAWRGPSSARLPLAGAAVGAALAALTSSSGNSLATVHDRVHAAAMLVFFLGAIAALWALHAATPRHSRARVASLLVALITTLLFLTTAALKIAHSSGLPLLQRLLLGSLLLALALTWWRQWPAA